MSKITTEFIATVVKKLNTHRTVLKQALTTLESLKTTWHSHACDINELVTSPRVQTLKVPLTYNFRLKVLDELMCFCRSRLSTAV